MFIDCETVDEDDFFDPADAAEKYNVWALKQLLRPHMMYASSFYHDRTHVTELNPFRSSDLSTNRMKELPLLVLHFAFEHGYTDLSIDAVVAETRLRIRRHNLLCPSGFDLENWVSTFLLASHGDYNSHPSLQKIIQRELSATDAFLDELASPPPSSDHALSITISIPSEATPVTSGGECDRIPGSV